MKRFLCILFAVTIAFVISGCSSREYKKAKALMDSGDYSSAMEIFESIEDYKDSSALLAECRNAEAYAAAVKLYEEGKYEESFDAFSVLSGYKDAERYIDDSRNAIRTAYLEVSQANVTYYLEQYDAQELFHTVMECYDFEYSNEKMISEINSYVIDAIQRESDNAPYEYFLFLDEFVDITAEHEQMWDNIGKWVSNFNDTLVEERTIAFLVGNWVRVDTSKSNGLQITIVNEDGELSAFVRNGFEFQSQGVTFHWDKGMNIWKDIQVVDSTSINLQAMTLHYYLYLGEQTTSHEAGVGRIDYSGMRIVQQSDSSEEVSWNYGIKSIIYVRESAIKDPIPLGTTDYVVSNSGTKEDEDKTNIVELLSTQDLYWINANNALRTSRGITTGSSYLDVINAYGYGRGNLYIEKEDPVFIKLKALGTENEETGVLLCSILSEQADEFMEYTDEELNITMRIYFKEGIVTWICWYNM